MKQLSSNCCSYCGSYNESRDHFIPVSYIRTRRDYRTKDIIPCCLECNVLLGDKIFDTFELRCEYLVSRYERRYKKILNSEPWGQNELSSMGYSIKTFIASTDQKRLFIKAKLDNLERFVSNSEIKPIFFDQRCEFREILFIKNIVPIIKPKKKTVYEAFLPHVKTYVMTSIGIFKGLDKAIEEYNERQQLINPRMLSFFEIHKYPENTEGMLIRFVG